MLQKWLQGLGPMHHAVVSRAYWLQEVVIRGWNVFVQYFATAHCPMRQYLKT